MQANTSGARRVCTGKSKGELHTQVRLVSRGDTNAPPNSVVGLTWPGEMLIDAGVVLAKAPRTDCCHVLEGTLSTTDRKNASICHNHIHAKQVWAAGREPRRGRERGHSSVFSSPSRDIRTQPSSVEIEEARNR